MDIIKLYQDYNIPYLTEGNKHCASGWIQTNCPHCAGSKNYHLGWNVNNEYFNCYRCGWHPVTKTISLLLGISTQETVIILKKYGKYTQRIKKPVETSKKPLILPTGLIPLTTQHKNYLKERGFNPEELEKRWGLKSTGPLSNVKGLWYKHRIFIPFFWDGILVTFDTRDVTGKQEDKYKGCPKERERKGRKEILYGIQENWVGGIGICVEGPVDTWGFEDYPVFATSGIEFTIKQVRLISQIFKIVFIIYDNEPTAQQQARKLKEELELRSIIAVNIMLENYNDTGEMPRKEILKLAEKIKKQGNKLLKNVYKTKEKF